MHTFDIADLPPTPWKNGGGSTREIVCRPPGANMDSFEWRVSVATIAANGPFSVFPGVDRVIMLLDGAGVRLQGTGIDQRLDTPGVPFAFSGDVALDCALLGGPSTDFNVMTRRSQWRAEVTVLTGTRQIATAPSGLALAVRGRWHLQSGAHDFRCAPGTGMWWDAAAKWKATPLTPDAMLVAVRLHDLKS
ncbi:HutD family protein [Hydrogenophaga sp.]|uniref:HutD/Ves family protein n=1 Tax=Hydrogenophaga sp. TaxID=1904254 RepID=UPI0025B935C5|nr:HutD family protein [Hydrogenophaga sp.]MBT9465998.1 HutD family protein [Hydrogenophaga sp.]